MNWTGIVGVLRNPPVKIWGDGFIQTRCLRCGLSTYWSFDSEFATLAEAARWAHRGFVEGHRCGALSWEL